MRAGIKVKTIVPVIVLLIIAMFGMSLFNYFSQTGIMNSEAEKNLKSAVTFTESAYAEQLTVYLQMARLVAKMPTIAEAFAKGDRNRLIHEFLGGFEGIKKGFKITQFHFHKPPAVSFLRLAQPEKYGDDLSAFRHTVLAANEKKTPIMGIEVGKAGIGLRSVEPIAYKGEHIGTVEFGGDMSHAINETKTIFGVEAGLLIAKKDYTVPFTEIKADIKPIGDYFLIYSTTPDLFLNALNPENIARAKTAAAQKGIHIQDIDYKGSNYHLAFSPLKDFSGKKIGYICAFKDKTALQSAIQRALFVNLGIYGAILVALALMINLALQRVVNPIVALTESAGNISMGKLSEKIEIKTNDEIEDLAKSMDRMRVSMKKLLE
ncbi:MAG: hypothetical protein CVV37_03835 [Nitrospira bacterium HGW-Nitrospira-1]|nr:MAG: hypothetical protein CVV37_03835 [Nitrospira bacterium HGW-Nitrospira-1]